MFDGEKGKKKFKITEMPLVPPSNKECGKINNTVLTAYKAQPSIINK